MGPSPRPARTLAAFRLLETAEEYLDFFGIRYAPEVLAAGRLVILRQLSRELAAVDGLTPPLEEPERLRRYEECLRRAYAVFRWSGPEAERLVLLGGRTPGSGCGGCGGGAGCGA
ncbi:nitrogenase-stabilizing/protective protein NifW [Anaeromyxobacter paludicola]|uniref:Nitrogenase-stabilizing/protective protein NifW n=1 Tax=Anaeromyxobacter paludicola TaxID=2918171 RepID=A0ABN6NEW5_9BACT|nr:nitrogenase-stabilizing/protective protein NifW [Anaeromyxobacter paludicola]BDG10848.1 hypothetical protein AMPC_39610 [Anaeromyxobacter paludicola]